MRRGNYCSPPNMLLFIRVVTCFFFFFFLFAFAFAFSFFYIFLFLFFHIEFIENWTLLFILFFYTGLSWFQKNIMICGWCSVLLLSIFSIILLNKKWFNILLNKKWFKNRINWGGEIIVLSSHVIIVHWNNNMFFFFFLLLSPFSFLLSLSFFFIFIFILGLLRIEFCFYFFYMGLSWFQKNILIFDWCLVLRSFTFSTILLNKK